MINDHPVDQVYGDRTAGGAGWQDADEGRPHDASGEPSSLPNPHPHPPFVNSIGQTSPAPLWP